LPGESFFRAESPEAGSALIKLRDAAAKEGLDKYGKAISLMFVPVGWFVHGKDAE
jgi:hypothetical protein